jgi:hypothetical protein
MNISCDILQCLVLLADAPEGKSEPFSKCTATDLDMKLAIRKYEGGQSSSATASELRFAASTVNTIVKDAARIKVQEKGMAIMNFMIITRKCEGAISEISDGGDVGAFCGTFHMLRTSITDQCNM